jgi:hypothetical protein
MDKKSFAIKRLENVQLAYQGFNIEILPYISQTVKLELSRNYINFLFAPGEMVDNYLQAEWSIILGILDRCTNIDVDAENHPEEFEDIISSGLWDNIKVQIVNYKEFREDLNKVYNFVLSQNTAEKSLSRNFDELTVKAIAFIDKISQMDFSQEGIAQLVDNLNSNVKKFKEDFPTSEVKPPKKKKENLTSE